MIEISLKPVQSISVEQFEERSKASTKKRVVAFVDNSGNIHALDVDMYGVRFLPLAAAGAVPVMFSGATEPEVVTQALKSGYRVFQYDNIFAMVHHFVSLART